MSKRSKRKKRKATHSAQAMVTPTSAPTQPQPEKQIQSTPRVKRTRKKAKRQTGFSVPWWGYIVGLVVVVGLLLAWGTSGQQTSDSGAPSGVTIENPSLGMDDAPITLIEFGDFGCPACQGWHLAGIRDEILENYGDSVRYEWHDYPIITSASPKAAEAGRCAQEQGMFFEYQDLAYQNENFGRLGRGDLERLAQLLNLDMQEFTACLDSNRYEATVRADWDEARSLRLRGTPAWLVNGQYLASAQPEQLANAIDFALAQLENE